MSRYSSVGPLEDDTMANLAEQLLGNPLTSYQLARYNGLDNPALLAPGQVRRIPGHPARSSSREAAPPTRSASSALPNRLPRRVPRLRHDREAGRSSP